jgi:hypothetical protein
LKNGGVREGRKEAIMANRNSGSRAVDVDVVEDIEIDPEKTGEQLEKEAILANNPYSVAKVKTFRGREGEGFNATLLRDGKAVALVMDEAQGGEYRFEWKDGFRDTKEEKKLEAFIDERRTAVPAKDQDIYCADIFVGDLVNEFLNDRKFRRLCKANTVYQYGKAVGSDKWSVMKGTDPATRNWIVKQAKGMRVVFMNDRYDDKSVPKEDGKRKPAQEPPDPKLVITPPPPRTKEPGIHIGGKKYVPEVPANTDPNWFQVDKEGLAKLLARKGKDYVVNELIQNAWDTDAKRVTVTLEPVKGKALAKLCVEDDDPEGFHDLRHAFTLFAESQKKNDPEKRGRFNVGEKLVLALCEDATISTTKGTISFGKDGRVHTGEKRKAGSVFTATIRLSMEEYHDICAAVSTLIPPVGVVTTFNGDTLRERKPLHTFSVILPTEAADLEGRLRKLERKTKVEVHEVLPSEKAKIYEMGIPVVETDDRWHYNVMQKVPLNHDRDNVTPAYLKIVRAHVLNQMHDHLEKADGASEWVRDGAGHRDVSKDAMDAVLDIRFGEKRVAYDPSDHEGSKIAMSQGYAVIHSGSLSGDEWANVKRHESVLPAGKVTPSPRPDDDEKAHKLIDHAKHTDGMRNIVAYAKALSKELMGHDVRVEIGNNPSANYSAHYTEPIKRLVINMGRVGRKWFDNGPTPTVNELLIHEFGHDYSGDHLSTEYHDALCRLGAKLAQLALTNPKFFKPYTVKA